jgi:hypothetical protein
MLAGGSCRAASQGTLALIIEPGHLTSSERDACDLHPRPAPETVCTRLLPLLQSSSAQNFSAALDARKKALFLRLVAEWVGLRNVPVCLSPESDFSLRVGG